MKLDITRESRSQTLWGYSLIEIKCVCMVIPIQLIGMHLHVISLPTIWLSSFHFVYKNITVNFSSLASSQFYVENRVDTSGIFVEY